MYLLRCILDKKKPHRKLEVEFVSSITPVDIESLDSKSSLVQLMLQVVKVGLRVDERGIDSSIIREEKKDDKSEE